MKTRCPLCEGRKWFWQGVCRDCSRLFALVRENMGRVGMGQLMDTLIATGIEKSRIKKFLENDPEGKGSVMDQILAHLTNNLAQGIGVKESDMGAADVKRIRENPTFGSSTKPLRE